MYDGFPERSLGGGTGGRWNVTWAAVPHFDGSLTFFSFSTSPFLGVVLVLAIEQNFFIRWNNKFARTTTNRKMMLCNDFPGWWEGYCALLRMIPSRQPGKSLHSIISRFVVVLANLLFHLLKCLGLKHQRRQGWRGWVRGRRRGELCVRRHFRWCHRPTWRSVQS